MTQEISKIYNPTDFESDLYSWWEKNGYFKPEKLKELNIINENSEPFTITLPPPNVTGVLHLGHALTIALEDLMIRYARMNGKNTLFLPGTDHAGIATQNVVERELNKNGIKRKELGREKFVENVWKWKEKSHATIVEQSRKMGMSSDWEREAFTMDENLSIAVKEAFVSMYNNDLIYRGSYLVNWCPGRCESAVSSLEAIPEEIDSHLWYFKYPIKTKQWQGPSNKWGSGKWASGAKQFISIATTRPETMLGDTAIATSREHKKYGKMIGKLAILPILGRELRIITDEHVDSEFGTGALKITPSHDFNDYEIGKRHNLEFITMMDEKGKILKEHGGNYAGMDRFEARKAIVEDMEKEGLLVKIEPHTHSIPHCERCHTIIEPRDSIQWFVRTKPLADKVIKLMEKEAVEFIPHKFDERFRYWMENIHDWCISRQLWWGHRIPVWYCENDHINASRDTPDHCNSCDSMALRQDEDVLDTWFSSGLWPFSTLGWPEKTADMDTYYSNTVRETGYDILLFWVAREMMLGAELTNTLPYHKIYFHGLIRNEAGKKISKSMENIDDYNPLLIIGKYGADTLRYTLLTNSTAGLDMNLDPKTIESTGKFGNKIWQATRFLLGNIDGYKFEEITSIKYDEFEIEDKWILSRLHNLIKYVSESMDKFDFLNAGREIKRFFWNEFADWYIEISKLRIYTDNKGINPRHILLHVLDTIFRLLHPYMPYITEKLWQELPSQFKSQPALIISEWPEVNSSLINEKIERNFTVLIELIVNIRRIRNEFKVPPSKKIPLTLISKVHHQMLNDSMSIISRLSNIEEDSFTILKKMNIPKKSVSDSVDNIDLVIPLEGLVEIDKEITRLEKEKGKIEKLIFGINKKLGGEFVNRAPADLVEKEKVKLENYNKSLSKIVEQITNLTE